VAASCSRLWQSMKTFKYSITVNEIEAETEDEANEIITDMLANGSFDVELVEVIEQ
jgi:hypothetical protein